MISGIYDINNNIIKDINITSHFNKRLSFLQKINTFKKNDILLFDRGYFSYNMINECINKKLKFIFRIKESMFKEMFFMKNFNNDKSCIVYYKDLKLRIVKYGKLEKIYSKNPQPNDYSYKDLPNFSKEFFLFQKPKILTIS